MPLEEVKNVTEMLQNTNFNTIPTCPSAPKKRHIQIYDKNTDEWSFMKVQKSPIELLNLRDQENKEN
jgi:hypothetical protein